MYNIPKGTKWVSGHIPKAVQETFCGADQVLCYIKSWDKSHWDSGYSLCAAQCAHRVVGHFLQEMGMIENNQLPKIDVQYERVYSRFNEFKTWLNEKHKEGKLKDLA